MDNRSYQKVWQYIKTMKYFTIMEIQILLALDNENTLNIESLEKYLIQLYNFGIIKQAEEDTYVLKEDLGYFAPKCFSDSVIYNPNNDKIVAFSGQNFNSNVTNSINLYNGGKNDETTH